MPDPPVIEFDSVVKRFGPVTALRGLSLRVPPGRVTAVLGPSGCGKSTLLRLVVGLIVPDSGTVRFEGETMAPETAFRLRRRMGYVIQDGGLFPHLTAKENVALMARHLGWDGARVSARLEELAALTRFPSGGWSRYPVQLSGGQRQRVGLMRALMLDPDLLLLDEPLGALDPMIRAGLQEELQAIFRTLGKTVLLITHDLAEAGFLGDEIVLLREGSLVQHGSLATLVRSPADPFVTEFVNAQRSPLDSLDAPPA